MIKYNNNWKPEYEELTTKFDERFEIDRMFRYVDNKRIHRIRFVKYPNTPENCVNVFYYSMLKDSILEEKSMSYNIDPELFNNKEILTFKEVWMKYRYDITGKYNRKKKFERIFLQNN